MALCSDETKIGIGYGIGTVVVVATLVCAYVGGSNAPLQLMLCLLGGALGWTVGIVLSPLDEDEGSTFGSMGKAAAAVLSGFAAAKLEEPVVKEVANALAQDGHLYSLRVTLFLTMFVIGFLFTLISRLYGQDATERRKRRQARLLAGAAALIEKVEKLEREASERANGTDAASAEGRKTRRASR